MAQRKEFLMTKIFVRERTRIGKGEGLPRFAIVGVEGSDLKFFQLHVRKSELDAIAQSVGAEVVMLPRGTGEDAGEGSGGGKRQKKSASKRKTKGNA
jgi:acyl-[acyl carrier protein]--UDP-N-acetylglucosamine O-acyltransferase